MFVLCIKTTSAGKCSHTQVRHLITSVSFFGQKSHTIRQLLLRWHSPTALLINLQPLPSGKTTKRQNHAKISLECAVKQFAFNLHTPILCFALGIGSTPKVAAFLCLYSSQVRVICSSMTPSIGQMRAQYHCAIQLGYFDVALMPRLCLQKLPH